VFSHQAVNWSLRQLFYLGKIMNQLEKFNRNLFLDFIGDNSLADFIVKPLYSRYLPIRLSVDLIENSSAYIVTAELPGVNKEDIEVSVQGNTVTISCEIKNDSEEKKDDRIVKSERYYGFVSRTLQLDLEVDSLKTEAQYKDGILTLTLPKLNDTKGQRITIN
jgi:HSP20 family protein